MRSARGESAARYAATKDNPLLAGGEQRAAHLVKEKLQALAEQVGLKVTPYQNTLTMMARRLPGGRNYLFSLLYIAAAAKSDPAMRVWNVFADLTTLEQKRANIDQLCLASGVSPAELVGALASIGHQYSIDVADLFRSAAHPDLVLKTIESAMRIKGKDAAVALADRRMLHEGMGFVPLPKGTGPTINVTANAAAAATAPTVPSFLTDVTAADTARTAVQQRIVEGEVVASGALPPAAPAVDETTIEWPE